MSAQDGPRRHKLAAVEVLSQTHHRAGALLELVSCDPGHHEAARRRRARARARAHAPPRKRSAIAPLLGAPPSLGGRSYALARAASTREWSTSLGAIWRIRMMKASPSLRSPAKLEICDGWPAWRRWKLNQRCKICRERRDHPVGSPRRRQRWPRTAADRHRQSHLVRRHVHQRREGLALLQEADELRVARHVDAYGDAPPTRRTAAADTVSLTSSSKRRRAPQEPAATHVLFMRCTRKTCQIRLSTSSSFRSMMSLAAMPWIYMPTRPSTAECAPTSGQSTRTVVHSADVAPRLWAPTAPCSRWRGHPAGPSRGCS